MKNFDYEPYLEKFNSFMILRDLSKNTARNYKSYLLQYFSWLGNQDKFPEDVSYDDLRNYLLYLKTSRKLNNKTINSHNAQLRFFTIYVLENSWDSFLVPKMKTYNTLPEILTKQEAANLIHAADNLKHKAMLALMYSAGLRKSEVLHLKYKDISRINMKIYISPSKSRSDRYAILSDKTLGILTDYWHVQGKPKDWLFPGTKKNSHVTRGLIDYSLKNYAKKAGISKNISAHTLRHSFAAHLYEQGVDLLAIQKLLGHKCINSTTLYIQLAKTTFSKISSPFDLEV